VSGGKPDPLEAIARDVARITAENARLLERLAQGEKRFRIISQGILRIQEAERGRISRELHDGVGQSLTALKMQLEVLERSLGPADAALRSRLADLTGIADRSLQDVRQLSRLLRPQMLDELGLVPTLRWLARTVQESTGLAVDLSIEGMEERAAPDVETVVYRVVQEALTNVAKHAQAASAQVRLRRSSDRLLLSVRDEGRGFDPAAALGAEETRGSGLRGMRDRVDLFGGRFELRSAVSGGTAVEIELPLAGAS
jgi:two-component system sensor histidine kinase UhpB